jgi:hypothetical protein
MVQRCTNPARNNWHDYGGRGIKVCRRWLKFDNFLADMGERPPGTSIGRRDCDGGYSPANCEWQTDIQQNRQRRNSRLDPLKAEAIRRRYARGNETQRGLGKEYGVSKTMIRNVVTGRAWA